jgi:hypothetical protein
MVLCASLQDVMTYYEKSAKGDSRWISYGVGIAALLATWVATSLRLRVCLTFRMMLALNTAQTYELVYYAESSISTVMRFDMIANFSTMLLGGFFSGAATSYYSWRAWKVGPSASVRGATQVTRRWRARNGGSPHCSSSASSASSPCPSRESYLQPSSKPASRRSHAHHSASCRSVCRCR